MTRLPSHPFKKQRHLSLRFVYLLVKEREVGLLSGR
jgi:hypothetical protein